jgi:hypothetical protein
MAQGFGNVACMDEQLAQNNSTGNQHSKKAKDFEGNALSLSSLFQSRRENCP